MSCKAWLSSKQVLGALQPRLGDLGPQFQEHERDDDQQELDDDEDTTAATYVSVEYLPATSAAVNASARNAAFTAGALAFASDFQTPSRASSRPDRTAVTNSW